MSLSLLYQPEGSPSTARIDIVAIHGLGGDPVNTWSHPQSKAYWLKDFLPERIPDARILTFGYNATAAFGDSTANVVDHARSLLVSLVDKRDEDEETTRPLVFIVHSLGGIVVKQALLSARLEPRYRTICDATVGIIFFGTPHRGSDLAAYGKVLANIAQTMLHKPTSPLLDALKTNSMVLQQLTTDFRHQLPRYQIVSFYEQRPIKSLKHLVVEKYSALLEVVNEEQIPVDADHRAICRFEKNDDDTFDQTWRRIQRMRKEPKFPESVMLPRPDVQSSITRPYNNHYDVPHLLSPVFTGHDEICQALESSLILSMAPRQAVQRRFVLYGLGGSGKTQICLKYAQTHRERYWGVFWVDASTHASIEQSLKSIAHLLQTEHTTDSVKRTLANSPHNWLLILDNADDPELRLTSYFPTGDRGDIIITSRNLSSHQYNTVGAREIGMMSVEDSLTLLLRTIYRDVLPGDSAHQEGTLIVQALGCLALAVTQAGAYIRETSCSFQDYVELYQRRREEIWAYHPKHGDTDYRHTVYTTWQVSLEMIISMQEPRSEYAIKLLQLLCFYHHEQFPLAILTEAWLNWSEEDERIAIWLPWPQNLSDDFELRRIIQKCVMLLTSYSLVARDSNETLSLHPLVQEWYQKQIFESERSAGCLRALSILAKSDNCEYAGKDFSYRRALATHTLAAFRKFELSGARIGQAEDDIGCASWLNLVSIFSDNGFPKEAITISEQVLDLRNCEYGHNHPLTLFAMHNLAIQYSAAGRRREALQLNVQVVQLRKVKLGEAHIDTLRSMHSLSIRYDEMGREAESLRLAKHVLRLRMDTLGEEHSDTLSSIQYLAGLYSELGRHEQAMQMAKRSVYLAQRLLGEEHSQTLSSMRTLALCYAENGQEEEALQLSEQVTKLMTTKFGENHPNTIIAMRALAGSYHEAGRYQEALQLIEHVVRLAKEKFGDEHPETLVALSNQPTYYHDVGQWQKALQLREEVLQLNKTNFGEEHRYTLATSLNLAAAYSDLGRNEEAVKTTEQVLQIQKRKLGDEHPDTLSSMRNLAAYYANVGRKDEAIQLTLHVVQVSKTKLGMEHLKTLNRMQSLALRYRDAERQEEALQLMEQVTRSLKSKVGDNHLDTLDVMQSLASLYIGARQSEAVPLIEQVVTLMKAKFGEDHPSTVGATKNVITCYVKVGRDKEALQLAEQVVKLQKDKLGNKHHKTLNSMHTLAYLYLKTGQPSDSLRLRQLIFEVRKSQSGEDDFYTLGSMEELAIVHGELEQYDIALEITEKIMKIRRNKLGEKHPDTLTSMHCLALWYSRVGRTEALELTTKVVQLRKTELGPNHPDTLVSMHNLAVRYLEAGRLEEALQTTEQVVQLRKSTLGENNLLTLNSMHNLGAQYERAGRRDEAIQLVQHVSEQRQNQLGDSHPDTILSLELLAFLSEG